MCVFARGSDWMGNPQPAACLLLESPINCTITWGIRANCTITRGIPVLPRSHVVNSHSCRHHRAGQKSDARTASALLTPSYYHSQPSNSDERAQNCCALRTFPSLLCSVLLISSRSVAGEMAPRKIFEFFAFTLLIISPLLHIYPPRSLELRYKQILPGR
jgi:hypothetical protein